MKKFGLALFLILLGLPAFAVNFGFPVVMTSKVVTIPFVNTIAIDTTLTEPVFAIYSYSASAANKTLTLGETNAVTGQWLCVYNSGATSFTVADDTGGTQVLTQYKEACYVYQIDRWVARTTGSTTYSGVDQASAYTWTALHTFNGTISIGGGTAITSVPTASSSINFTALTSACEDSAAVLVTGAADGDRCIIGVPAALWGTGDIYSCYVSSAGNVKARHCNLGTGGDPGGATSINFTVIHY